MTTTSVSQDLQTFPRNTLQYLDSVRPAQLIRAPDMTISLGLATAAATALDNPDILPHGSDQLCRKTRASIPSHIKLDDLFQRWREDIMSASSLACSGSPETEKHLLDDLTLDFGEKLALHTTAMATATEPSPQGSPNTFSLSSISSESLPSLCQDCDSEPSWGSPSSSSFLTAAPSIAPLEKCRRRPRSLILLPSETPDIHPLDSAYAIVDDDGCMPDDVALSLPINTSKAEPRSGLRPLISLSLQTLKSRALYSLQSFSLQNRFVVPAGGAKKPAESTQTDGLWSHPYLFPRLSSEIRPQPFADAPTVSERHYFNPTTPLTLDQQRASYREALHPPSVPRSTTRGATPLVPLQPSSATQCSTRRRTRRASTCSAESSSNKLPSHATAQLASSHVRRREPRENADFLRVAVLEMNMRRHGKLDDAAVGKARIWLPPRATTVRRQEPSYHSSGTDARSQVTPIRWSSILTSELV